LFVEKDLITFLEIQIGEKYMQYKMTPCTLSTSAEERTASYIVRRESHESELFSHYAAARERAISI